jgi:hypothetical protein
VGFPINFVVQASPCGFIFNPFLAIFLERVALVTLQEKNDIPEEKVSKVKLHGCNQNHLHKNLKFYGEKGKINFKL